jgi:hypothetical protein
MAEEDRDGSPLPPALEDDMASLVNRETVASRDGTARLRVVVLGFARTATAAEERGKVGEEAISCTFAEYAFDC